MFLRALQAQKEQSSSRVRKSPNTQPATAKYTVRGFGFAGARCYAVRNFLQEQEIEIRELRQLPAAISEGIASPPPLGALAKSSPLSLAFKLLFSLVPAPPGGNYTPAGDKNFPISSLMASILRGWGNAPMLAITRAYGKLHPQLHEQLGMIPSMRWPHAMRIEGIN